LLFLGRACGIERRGLELGFSLSGLGHQQGTDEWDKRQEHAVRVHPEMIPLLGCGWRGCRIRQLVPASGRSVVQDGAAATSPVSIDRTGPAESPPLDEPHASRNCGDDERDAQELETGRVVGFTGPDAADADGEDKHRDKVVHRVSFLRRRTCCRCGR
jgi:hypothetical protein